ncbi:hypothetical protein BCR39DRAFT_563621 [Naematelia encephala]|uniref:Xylanolytic transcriptional activator regulatory domain-containing protein n=1 Tax=Naematelia encephala TaxID=71784 RepID=A0A1Y2BJX0_9TREE|nr:hypothetical protein BCR39DRAFT_563621 [Naematelia encephala]
MSQDLHAQGATVAGSAIWQRTGAGIRMAFELALHRNISTAAIPFAQLNRRHRVWGACVIADRWLALQRGEALTVDLDDCDAPLPFPYPDHCSLGTDREPCFRFHQEVTKLSILLGRIYRLSCSPRGLDRADDLALYKFQADLDAWLAQIPSQWPYVNASPTHVEGIDVPEAASIMNLLIVAVEFTFLRGFSWPASRLPAHITFRPAPQRWPTLVDRALTAVAWLLTPQGAFYLDIWDMMIYPTSAFFEMTSP